MTRSPTPLRHRNLPLLLLQARESVITRFRPILNAHGVTEQQWRIVRALLEQPTLEPREIVEVCRISSPSLAGVLARMEETGLVQRVRHETDQRRVQVSLTRQARALAARIVPEIEAAYAAMETQIGSAALQEFYATLDRVIEALAA